MRFGYLYVTLYLVMMCFMIVRLQDAPDELAPRALIHMMLGLTLAPLLFLLLQKGPGDRSFVMSSIARFILTTGNSAATAAGSRP
jgi:hypothetical protein